MYRKLIFILIILAVADSVYAQDTTAPADTSLWKKGGVASLSVSQSSFTNWAAGGENNLNISSLISLYANRKTYKSNWENNLDLGYGIQQLSGGDLRKSEDKIEMNSKYGLRMTDKINYSFLLNAKSQFTEGFAYTDTTKTVVSGFLSPAYISLAAGLDYKPNEQLSVFYSPLTGKVTMVMNDSLAAIGAYGVDTGKNVRWELGTSASIKYQANLAENIMLKSKLDLFAAYIDLRAVDIYWENLIAFQITKLLTATLTTNLIYDQDILIPRDKELSPGVIVVENKPRTQFKQVFALGVTYKF